MIKTVTFFGTPCDFAILVLNQLIENDYTVAAHVVPGSRSHTEPVRALGSGSTGTRPGLLPMSGQRGTESPRIPTLEINDHSSETTVRVLEELESDLSVVCCYPRRLPEPLINAAGFGGVNVHPSLLPRYRGPDPLFWIYRDGELETGVSIHRVDAELDSGDILRQQRFKLPLGTPGTNTWKKSAAVGATLLLQSIESISDPLSSAIPQDRTKASYFSWPSDADLVIDPRDWDAWRVYHFCRGVIPLGHMARLVDSEHVRRVIEAVGYSDLRGSAGEPTTAAERVRCRDGEVYLRLGPVLF